MFLRSSMRRFRSLTAPFAPGFSASSCRASSTVNISSGETKKEKKASTVWQVDEQRKEKLASFGRSVAQCVPKVVQQVQVIPPSGYNESSPLDSSWDKLAIPPNEYDVLVSDIDEAELEKLGERKGIKHLSPGSFDSPAFPVKGYIHGLNNRYMIPLICRRSEKPSARIVNVWFLVDTGSPHTFLTEKAVDAIFGPGTTPFRDVDLSIQDENSTIECYLSHDHFEQVNILGTSAMLLLELSIHVNWKKRTFFLVKQ